MYELIFKLNSVGKTGLAFSEIHVSPYPTDGINIVIDNLFTVSSSETIFLGTGNLPVGCTLDCMMSFFGITALFQASETHPFTLAGLSIVMAYVLD